MTTQPVYREVLIVPARRVENKDDETFIRRIKSVLEFTLALELTLDGSAISSYCLRHTNIDPHVRTLIGIFFSSLGFTSGLANIQRVTRYSHYTLGPLALAATSVTLASSFTPIVTASPHGLLASAGFQIVGMTLNHLNDRLTLVNPSPDIERLSQGVHAWLIYLAGSTLFLGGMFLMDEVPITSIALIAVGAYMSVGAYFILPTSPMQKQD